MAEVKWIKLLTGMFDDEKIKLIENMPEADTILIIWIKLLTLAGKKNVNGYIFLTENIPYTDEMLATIFNRPLNTIRLALEIFKKYGMISYDKNNIIKIVNWEKHQNIEGLEKIREQNRLRQKKFRKKHKELPIPKKEITLNNVTVTKQIRLDKNKNKKKKKISFDFSPGDFIIDKDDPSKKIEKKRFVNLTREKIEQLNKKYPDVDVDGVNGELIRMEDWLMREKEKKDNGETNKLPTDYLRFIYNWLRREQNKYNAKKTT